MNRAIIWDYFKVKVKEFSICYGKTKAQHARNEIQSMEYQLDVLNKAIQVN